MTVTVTIASTPEEFAACAEIRRRVFIDEQGIDEYEQFADQAGRSFYFLAVDADAYVGTGRMRVCGGDVLIEHIAVLREARGHGVGRRLMLRMTAEARRKFPKSDIVLEPQSASAGFYATLGFVCEGPPYEKLGALRQRMRNASFMWFVDDDPLDAPFPSPKPVAEMSRRAQKRQTLFRGGLGDRPV